MMTRRFALIPGLLLTLGGCMTNATVELTKAPFDATTQLTNGTSGATKEFLDPTTEFTSSTTPGALADGRLLVGKPHRRLNGSVDGPPGPHEKCLSRSVQ
jgi:hypothetical protein